MSKSLRMALVVLAAVVGPGARAAEEVVTGLSPHSFATTLTRLEEAAKEKGFRVFARLDHAAAAKSVGQSMPSSTVLVIGNPRIGTERFLRFPTLAIDLPLKILVWEDQKGGVRITYNSAHHMLTLARRHGLPINDSAKEQAQRTETLMASLAEIATR